MQYKFVRRAFITSREERAARLAGRFAGATHYPLADALTPDEQAQLTSAMAHESGLAAALAAAVSAQSPSRSPLEVALAVHMILGRAPASPRADAQYGEPVCGVRLAASWMELPPTSRALELAFVLPQTGLSTQDLLMLAWHVLRRCVACWQVAESGETEFDTAIARAPDQTDARSVARSVTLQRVGPAGHEVELGLLPLSFETSQGAYAGALQAVCEPGGRVQFALVFRESPVSMALGGVSATAFVHELFDAYLLAAMRDIGATFAAARPA